MNKKLQGLLRFSLFFFLLTAMFSSCIPIKRIEYLQQEVEKTDTLRNHFYNDIAEYRIQPGDNLYIRVKSVLAASDNIFGEDQSRGSSNYYNDAGIYLNSYLVNTEGYIDFPFVGSVYLKDLTIEEAKDLISSIVKDYIREATVVVRLALFKITALGEVTRPGQLNIYQNRVTIYEAMAMAGDFTPFARRNQVILLRETQTGTKTVRLNLNDVSVLESEYFYIQPNDVIYVPPVKGKNFAFSQFPYALVFSTISTTLLLINFFKTN